MSSQRPLDALLGEAIHALWPRRSQQELLLDLGERKGWSESERSAQLLAAARWMQRELLLAPQVEVPHHRAPPPVLAAVRALGEALAPKPFSGVARSAEGLAPALGSSSKTLVNSLSVGIRASRSDHRWLLLLARLVAGDHPVDAWLFHRRSPASVSAELGSMARRHPYLDAVDAVLLLSLFALWQRRRPVTRARGNRGRIRSRRSTPKPVAALGGSLILLGQVQRLGEIAADMGGEAGRALLLLVLEAALTEAHLAPHSARRSAARSPGTGESLLAAVQEILESHASRLGQEAAAVLSFRVERMRAWRDGRPLQKFLLPTVRHPYVQASLLLERARNTVPPAQTFNPHTPGLLMLLPQLRSRGFQVSP